MIFYSARSRQASGNRIPTGGFQAFASRITYIDKKEAREKTRAENMHILLMIRPDSGTERQAIRHLVQWFLKAAKVSGLITCSMRQASRSAISALTPQCISISDMKRLRS